MILWLDSMKTILDSQAETVQAMVQCYAACAGSRAWGSTHVEVVWPERF